MCLTENTKANAILGGDGCASTGMIRGIGGARGVGYTLNACQLEHVFANALDGIKIDVAVSTNGEHSLFIGQFIGSFVRQINRSNFKQTNVFVVEVVVASNRLHHRGESRGAHDAGIFTKRIGNNNRAAQSAILCHTNLIVVFGADEGECVNLRKTHTNKSSFGVKLENLLIGAAAKSGFSVHIRSLNLVIAVNAANLLGDVVHATKVSTPRGNNNLAVLNLATKTGQGVYHMLLGNVHAKELIVSCGNKGKRNDLVFGGVNVNDSVNNLTCTQEFNELASTFKTCQAVLGVKTLFKTRGGFGTHTVLLCGYTNRCTVEASGLKYNSCSTVGNFGVCTAHNTCQSTRLFAICNYEHGVVESVVDIVQGFEALSVICATNVNLGTLKLGVIKRVHRLTVLQHYVVGNINDVVDGANARSTQTHTHPKGRGSNLYVLNHSCRIAVAEVGSGNTNANIIFNLVTVATTLNAGSGKLELAVKRNRGFTSKTDYRETVGAVRGDFELYAGVLKQENVANVGTKLVCAVLIEDENAVFFLAGALVGSQLQFTHRAEHTKGLNAAELACLNGDVTGQLCNGQSCGNKCANKYVLCTGYNLNIRTLVTCIKLANPQVVRVGVLFHSGDLCHNYVFNIFAKNLKALNLRAGNGQAIAVFFIANVANVNEISKPISGKIHVFYLLIKTVRGSVRRFHRTNECRQCRILPW